MKKSAIAVLAMLVCARAVHAAEGDHACQYREEPGTATKIEKTRISLLAVDPAEGGEVRRESVVSVDVEFQIADFEPKTFRFMANFPTKGLGSTGALDPGNSPYIESASGKVHLCVPLDELYESPMVLWPLSMRVEVLRETGGGSGTIAGSSSSVKFNAVDSPAGALERQAKAPPEEYYDALRHVSGFFNSRMTRYKACIARFPAMQPALTRAYRAWEGRHRADIDFVAELQFEDIKARFDGREVIAARIYDVTVQAAMKFFEDMPAAELKTQCENALAELADTEDVSDSAISDELKVLRRYQPGPSPEKGS